MPRVLVVPGPIRLDVDAVLDLEVVPDVLYDAGRSLPVIEQIADAIETAAHLEGYETYAASD